jgi:hypothetical protein
MQVSQQLHQLLQIYSQQQQQQQQQQQGQEQQQLVLSVQPLQHPQLMQLMLSGGHALLGYTLICQRCCINRLMFTCLRWCVEVCT